MATNSNFLQDLINEERELVEALDGLRAFIKYKRGKIGVIQNEIDFQPNTTKNISSFPKNLRPGMRPFHLAMANPPKEYTPRLTAIQKTAYAIFQLRHGDKYDVANYLLEKGDNQNKEALEVVVGQILSKIYREGLLNAEKDGFRYHYSLK